MIQRQVGLPNCGQDAGEEDLRIAFPRSLSSDGNQFRQFLFHLPQASPGQGARRKIGLQIELADFGSQPMIVGILQNRQNNWSRSQRPVKKKHLLLRADPANAALNPAGVDHPLQGGDIGKQRLHEDLGLMDVVFAGNVMLTHRSSMTWGGRSTFIRRAD
jgi:hypothetical protein